MKAPPPALRAGSIRAGGGAPGPTHAVPLTFQLPPHREATEPAEERGLDRDEVRLLVAAPGSISHARFRDLPHYLRPGDLVVVNTSATLPAAIDGRWRGRDLVVHFSTRRDDGTWVVELRRPDGNGPVLDAASGDRVDVVGGGTVQLLHPDHEAPGIEGVRLWVTHVDTPIPLPRHLAQHGRPITYGHVQRGFPLRDYQSVFAIHPGSAEMASAGRPFTADLVTAVVRRGVGVAPITLHAGVSSLEAGEPPRPERYVVPDATARMVNDTRRAGGRVVAVGTTVTRAIETVAGSDGTVRPGRGWTDLVLGEHRRARTVGGLVTGWHEPGSSHLALLEAVAGPTLVGRAYEAALVGPYLWHEFGDSCLLLP